MVRGRQQQIHGSTPPLHSMAVPHLRILPTTQSVLLELVSGRSVAQTLLLGFQQQLTC